MNMVEQKNINGKYLGREFVKEGVAQKSGKAWKLYKTKFECNTPSKVIQLSFTTFDTTPGMKELEENKSYKIDYEAEQRTHHSGGEYTAKTAKTFTATANNDNNGDNSTPPPKVDHDFDEVLEEFNKLYSTVTERIKRKMCCFSYFAKKNSPDIVKQFSDEWEARNVEEVPVEEFGDELE